VDALKNLRLVRVKKF